MKKIKILVAALFLLTVIGLCSAIAAFYMLDSAPATTETISFTVKNGATVRSVAHSLKERGAIRNSDFFVLLSYLDKGVALKRGTYTIKAKSRSREILAKIAQGNITTVQVTIPEGFNIFAIAQRLDSKKICKKSTFLFYAFDRDFLESRGIRGPSAEGYLFPETYAFAPNSNAQDVIIHLHNTMLKKLESLGYKENMPKNFDIHKLLIMASLVEKEAQVKSEQARVASVFHNRIKRNMRFDSDPTVRYAVKKFKGRIRYKDLDSLSPYNTYKHKGFMPGPIASPGLGAIKATLSPEKSSFLYFVARNDGSHYFSKSLSRHNKAVEYYQKNIRNGFNDDQL